MGCDLKTSSMPRLPEKGFSKIKLQGFGDDLQGMNARKG